MLPIRAPAPGFETCMGYNLLFFMPPSMVNPVVNNLALHVHTNEERYLHEFLKAVVEAFAYSTTFEHAAQVYVMVIAHCPARPHRHVDLTWRFMKEFEGQWGTTCSNMKMLATLAGLFEVSGQQSGQQAS